MRDYIDIKKDIHGELMILSCDKTVICKCVDGNEYRKNYTTPAEAAETARKLIAIYPMGWYLIK